MTAAADWRARVGDVWADEWRRTDRSLADLSRHLDAAILSAAPAGPAAVLDIGCGAGATAGALHTARPDLAVTGLDLSAPLVAVARARFPDVAFRVADAATDPLPPAPELLVSRHGVMFFADPVAAFARLHAAAAPGARLVFSCFRERSRNAFAGDLVAAVGGAVPDDAGGHAPGPFAFASMERTATILADAGWTVGSAASVDFGYVAGEGDDPVADAVAFLSRIGPLASLLAAAPDRAGVAALLSAALARYRTGNRVVLPASAWIWRATKGEA